MPDEKTDATPLAGDEVQPQAGADGKPEDGGDLSQADIASLRDELKRTRREAAQYRTRAKELEEKEKQAEEASLSELEKTKKRAAELEAQLAAVQTEAWRQAAAVKAKLPPELANRIQGKTPEDMEADAAELAKLLPPPAVKTPGIAATQPGQNATGEAPKPQRFGQIDPFDPAFVAAHGGGIISKE